MPSTPCTRCSRNGRELIAAMRVLTTLLNSLVAQRTDRIDARSRHSGHQIGPERDEQ